MKKIAIFASGSGTNAQNIIEHFADSENVSVSLVLSNRKDAYVLKRAEMHNVKTITFSRRDFYESDIILNRLVEYKIDLVVLAGFLWLVPENILHCFNGRIVNIHPALLPKYGGKGMYGMNVHRSVIEEGESISGISIHHVNEQYDDGAIIFQSTCKIEKNETPESLAEKIHELEYKYYPAIIEKLLIDNT